MEGGLNERKAIHLQWKRQGQRRRTGKLRMDGDGEMTNWRGKKRNKKDRKIEI